MAASPDAPEQEREQLQPALIPHSKPLSLIPVGLKEAALDSPTFRATAVHFADQIDAVERWLDGYVKSASKLAQEVAVLEGLVNSFLSNSIPPNQLSEAVLDHDYTLLSMRRYGEGAREFWTHTIDGMKKTQELLIDPIRNFLHNEVRPFKDARRQLESMQKSFDSTIGRYASQARTKEPSALREDAFQLHEARRAYLKAALDFTLLAPHLRASLDTLLIKIFSDQWMRMRDFREASSASFGKFSLEIDRVRDWSREMATGERILKRELFLARRQIEDSAESISRPSRDLEDYAASTVAYLGSRPTGPLRTLGDGGMQSSSKQGWLFLRTLTGKPTRTVWMRRWFFVKNGIFGWLAQGARAGGVEESEKIGVLLCSVRPAFQEERRFCFEVKTKDSTILLQAETQTELTEWISVFEIAKQRALEEPPPMDLMASGGNYSTDPTFAVNPAVAPELAAKRADGQITNIADEPVDRLLSPDITDSPAALAPRGSFDVNTLRKTGTDRDSDPGREHSSRLRQKLDLARKSTGLSSHSTGSASAVPPSLSGGIASLISASHSAMPVGPGRPPSAADQKSGATLQSSSTLAPATLVSPPAPTSLSKTAVMIGVERGFDLGAVDFTGGMPSGLMANQWGSANYGHISRLDRGEIARSGNGDKVTSSAKPVLEKRSSDPSHDSEMTTLAADSPFGRTPEGSPRMSGAPSPVHRKTISAMDVSPRRKPVADFPSYYPHPLKAHDAQFRMLFPNVPSDDRVVLVFRASWNPDEHQDLPGRVFVTMHDMYFYSNHLGFVLITGISLKSVSDVSVESGKSHDFIYLQLHGRTGKDDTSTVTIKTFLEPLKLLQARLRYLAANADAEEPVGLDQVLDALVKMEAEVSDSAELESLNDAVVDSGKRSTDIKANLRIDRSLYGGDGAGFLEDFNKFQLPSQPVIYTPRTARNLAIEKVFDVSAKALFHIIFGDKSVIYQLLYRERRGHTVVQNPWVKQDPGHLTRSFEYQVDAQDNIRRSTRINISDSQTLHVLNDHLCYVITDVKTPWHLPRAANFSMVSKIVITHVSKSTSKLAIFTTVEWAKRSAFSSMIERHAMDDLHVDALDLVDIVIDQVQKLGPSCTTKRAVQIFGQLGHQTDAAQITAGDLPASVANSGRVVIRQRTLGRLVVETVTSVGLSAVSTLLMSSIALIRAVFSNASAHTVLLALLATSVGLHLFSSSQTAASWWRDRNAAAFMAKLGVGPNAMMSKAIYLHDIEVLSAAPVDVVGGLDTTCSKMFQDVLNHGNLDAAPYSYVSKFSEPSTKSLARRLHHTRQRIGVHRHDLLVAMRFVNRVERETVQAEYENWLVDETFKCKQIETLLGNMNSTNNKEEKARRKKLLETLGPDNAAYVGEWHKEYCDGCRREFEFVNAAAG